MVMIIIGPEKQLPFGPAGISWLGIVPRFWGFGWWDGTMARWTFVWFKSVFAVTVGLVCVVVGYGKVTHNLPVRAIHGPILTDCLCLQPRARHGCCSRTSRRERNAWRRQHSRSCCRTRCTLSRRSSSSRVVSLARSARPASTTRCTAQHARTRSRSSCCLSAGLRSEWRSHWRWRYPTCRCCSSRGQLPWLPGFQMLPRAPNRLTH